MVLVCSAMAVPSAYAQDTTRVPPDPVEELPAPAVSEDEPEELPSPDEEGEPTQEINPQVDQADSQNVQRRDPGPEQPGVLPAQPSPDTSQISSAQQLDTLRASTPDTPMAASRVSPAQAAFRRILEAVSDSTGGLTPSGVLFPFPEHLAGMVWERPDSTADALDALLAMRLSGVRVVRTEVIKDPMLFRAADELGISFYQDLPVANLPAGHLLDTLSFAERELRDMLRMAQVYNSARHFGLARYADTSDPAARAYFERLALVVQQEGPEGSSTYYLTRFPEDDRCNQTVDFVLLDARQDAPSEILARWRLHHDTPAGIGAFGAPVRSGLEGGWRRHGTLAYQGRTLENGIQSVLAMEYPLRALFVYHWSEYGAEPRDHKAAVEGFSYALIDEDGLGRPALHVVRGFFTGTQHVFAFDAGSPGEAARLASPMVLLGWLIVLALGLVDWTVPRFGMLASKYFGRHDLYCESIQRGYDLNAGLNALISIGLALAAGVAGASVLRGFARTDALSTAISSWSMASQERLTQLLGEPLIFVLLLALGYALWLLFNILWLYLLAGRRYRIRAQQALTLAIWSRWPVFGLMVVAMLLATFSPQTATALAPLILFLWLGIEVVAIGRMLNDFARVTRVPIQRAMLIGYGAPMGLILVVIVSLLVTGSAELTFLWHLATRQ